MKLCVNHHIVYHQSYDLGLINRIQSSSPNRYQEANLGGHWQQKMRAQNDLAMFMKTSGYSPLSSMKPMLVQMPVFVSVFLALRFVCDQVDSVLCAFNMATKKKNWTLFLQRNGQSARGEHEVWRPVLVHQPHYRRSILPSSLVQQPIIVGSGRFAKFLQLRFCLLLTVFRFEKSIWLSTKRPLPCRWSLAWSLCPLQKWKGNRNGSWEPFRSLCSLFSASSLG